MRTKLVVTIALVTVMAGAAAAEWVYNDYETYVSPWRQVSAHDWWLKTRYIESAPFASGNGSTVKAMLAFDIQAGGTEITASLAGVGTLTENAHAIAEWLWEGPEEEAPLKSYMGGSQELKHIPEGDARIGFPPGNKYVGNYMCKGNSMSWACAGINAVGDPVFGGSQRWPQQCSDYLNCPKNGIHDHMHHPGYGDPPAMDVFNLTCNPSAERILWGKVNLHAQATGSFDASTSAINPSSQAYGPLGPAMYSAYYTVSCTH